jgi:hypothetical protein
MILLLDDIYEIFALPNTLGYPGVLLISFVGSIIIFVPNLISLHLVADLS